MDFDQVKDYLQKKLPEFTFTSGKEAGQHEDLFSAIRVTRDGKYLDIDVRKVKQESDASTLVDYIKGKWKISE